MPGKRAFEAQTDALDALRQQPENARVEPLRKTLRGKNNFLVAKAANLTREFNVQTLLPELLAAFDHFFENAEKSDPQCWAKNAISRALATFEHQDAEVFLRGMRHIQLEPTYGGRSDSAGTLRSTCALALVQCRTLHEPELLAHLVDLVADKEKAVRADVMRAIEQVGSPSASLLLRERAVLASDEAEVLGACYAGILGIEGEKAIPWVRQFLAPADDAAAEAALAIAATHTSAGFEVLRDTLKRARDPIFRSVVLSAIALTRQEVAFEFLLQEVRTESLDAEGAIEALLRSLPSQETIKKLEESVAGNARLARVVATNRKLSER